MAKKLGVIGGLGPLASAYFYELLSRMTEAKIDQEHMEINIISRPSIPDRTGYILGRNNDNPLPHLVEVGKTLEEMGVDYIALPCITAHYFHEELTNMINVPIIHVIKETVNYLKENGIKRAGIMATEGTISSKLFQTELLKKNIIPITPSKKGQEYISNLIYKNIKMGLPVNMEDFFKARDELSKNGADTIILGCTELSLIKRDEDIGSGFINALEILARSCITKCEAKLKSEYTNLIS